MSEEVIKFSPAILKRFRNSAIAIFVVSVFVCELPLLLALIGLGGLISADSIFSIPPYIEAVIYTAGVLALLMSLGMLIYRFRFRGNTKQ